MVGGNQSRRRTTLKSNYEDIVEDRMLGETTLNKL